MSFDPETFRGHFNVQAQRIGSTLSEVSCCFFRGEDLCTAAARLLNDQDPETDLGFNTEQLESAVEQADGFAGRVHFVSALLKIANQNALELAQAGAPVPEPPETR